MKKNQKQFAIDALRKLDKAANAGNVTSEGKMVILSFRDFNGRDELIAALVSCFRAVRELDEPEEEDASKIDNIPVGPFNQGTGGGKRNIRGTNSLS